MLLNSFQCPGPPSACNSTELASLKCPCVEAENPRSRAGCPHSWGVTLYLKLLIHETFAQGQRESELFPSLGGVLGVSH